MGNSNFTRALKLLGVV